MSIARTINSLINNNASLCFDEDDDLQIQLEGMGDWVRYFTMAINVSVDNKYLKNSLQLQQQTSCCYSLFDLE